MLSIFLLIPLSLMLFVVAIWAVRYAVKSNQFEDLDNASQRIILDDRQERRQTIQAHEHLDTAHHPDDTPPNNAVDKVTGDNIETDTINRTDTDDTPKI
ncbi:cbb3-type cytochrome oxidase assembly protein CcoS [Psychrobacter sp. CAL346-MNA-CIBAN-0220]|uniref:cbb3-type cytochrome oxidase assembly protein CcoS n=1 Tax=Psychrobacter sp. CAL346-MNA-CIBAN-0220 TaxID=3140457 RepID=UPI00332692EE